ncbi:unnamed protein product (macronuclear) [Paramecium tetraurelia]|uniref:Uncharacterized protein n=1 Tax=Paramecium tetraurelia TaxID=5888 RepID=A0D0P9_PARTE|nr:uncharacterized protein GSPATT00012168001 [Paramecium tetraurelia]CAK76616.1 unnamed protein product [Paramecium tetraurelia]|eukprot:XP_001444013.1 hypothetical protein (macronuclear) [Paramecium tetraurelia strain d4-2]
MNSIFELLDCYDEKEKEIFELQISHAIQALIQIKII